MCEPKFLIEDTYQSLYNNTTTRFDTPRKTKSKRVQLTDIMFVPSVQNKSLQFRAKTKTDGSQYTTVIYFDFVDYVEQNTAGAVSFKATDGTDYYIMPLQRSAKIKVNCECLDFYYRFSVWNDKKDSLFGDAPEPYVKKTQGREPVNPGKVPGLCVHILKLFNHLQKQRIMR